MAALTSHRVLLMLFMFSRKTLSLWAHKAIINIVAQLCVLRTKTVIKLAREGLEWQD